MTFTTTKQDFELILSIVERAERLAKKCGIRLARQTALMDITAAHCNGMPLKLDELASTDDFTFTHDVFGIFDHIDRNTGKLMNCFVPRLASRSTQ